MTAAILSPHPGTRCKPKPPPLHRRLLARLRTRRQRRQVEAARDDAYADTLHEMNDRRPDPGWTQEQWDHPELWGPDILGKPTWIGHTDECAPAAPPPADAFNVPPAAVLPDEITAADDHLRPDQYGDDTHAFSRYVDGGQE